MSAAPNSSRHFARGADVVAALALGACAFALYALSFQHAYWSDGRLLMAWVDAGVQRHYHVGYLPLAHLFARVLEPLSGGDVERPLLWLSASCTALAVAWTYLAARELGVGALAAGLCAGALATAPGTWFYATCVELHAPHLAVAAAATWWCARALQREREGALVPALWFLALFATHIGGALWLPALCAVALRREGRFGWPRDAWLALVAGLAFLAAWYAWTRELPSGRLFAAQAVMGAVEAWRPAALWTEWLEPACLLATLGLAGFVACATPRWRAFALWLVVPYLAIVPGFAYEERGAYFAGTWPALACGVGLALDRALASRSVAVRGSTLLLALLALFAQARAARDYVDAWERDYRGHEWVEPLRRELGNQGCVLVLDAWEREAVRKHSRLDAIALRDEGRVAQAAGLSVDAVAGMFDLAFGSGGAVAVAASVVDSSEGAALVPALAQRYGALREGAHAAYRVVPRPAAPPRPGP
ncbi:MAG: hypothetical protein EPO68_12820 [Planctomycetota bacterium]|nr:MAG: hypothetical protein EPO68_12820 [Planctomycetota bacterium]